MDCICLIDCKLKAKRLKEIFSDKVINIYSFEESKERFDETEHEIICVLTDENYFKADKMIKCSALIMPYENANRKLCKGINNTPLITYGSSDRATISYSSNSPDGLLISLQRSIKALNGEIIEPKELQCFIDEQTDTDFALISTAIKLLLE